MFFVRRPTERQIEAFVEDAKALPLSYARVGIARESGGDGQLDDAVSRIGRGASDFERARDALTRWKHFDLSWVQLFPRNAPIETGTVVAVRIQHLGFWSLNGARVVYQIPEADRRFGFAYGTLTNHAESGEELFEVLFDPATEDVTYHIRAVSRPRATLARIGYPFVRHLQARFRMDSARAMARAIKQA